MHALKAKDRFKSAQSSLTKNSSFSFLLAMAITCLFARACAVRCSPARGPRLGRGVPVLIRGVPPHTSWQDLKDFGREGGMVLFSDVRDGEG